jgi:Holliday junction resolvasome RuvABC endonuclease subunit
MHVVNIIDSLNVDNHTIKVYMEGVSYGSIGSAALIDLSFLNATIRMVLKMKEIEFVIVSPTSVKKFACANGQAEKDIMIDAWKRLDKNISDINTIKVDDLADAYFLSHYN